LNGIRAAHDPLKSLKAVWGEKEKEMGWTCYPRPFGRTQSRFASGAVFNLGLPWLLLLAWGWFLFKTYLQWR
jgi:hypothetical protein